MFLAIFSQTHLVTLKMAELEYKAAMEPRGLYSEKYRNFESSSVKCVQLCSM
jgi:hypothetical protein